MKTNVSLGLIAQLGLIYQIKTCLVSILIHLFVDNVSPRELLTLRVLAILGLPIPGIKHKITCYVKYTLGRFYISYAVTLYGQLPPLI